MIALLKHQLKLEWLKAPSIRTQHLQSGLQSSQGLAPGLFGVQGPCTGALLSKILISSIDDKKQKLIKALKSIVF
jgi:hypothetical protein